MDPIIFSVSSYVHHSCYVWKTMFLLGVNHPLWGHWTFEWCWDYWRFLKLEWKNHTMWSHYGLRHKILRLCTIFFIKSSVAHLGPNWNAVLDVCIISSKMDLAIWRWSLRQALIIPTPTPFADQALLPVFGQCDQTPHTLSWCLHCHFGL